MPVFVFLWGLGDVVGPFISGGRHRHLGTRRAARDRGPWSVPCSCFLSYRGAGTPSNRTLNRKAENLGGLPPSWIVHNGYFHCELSQLWNCREIRIMYIG